VNTTPPDAANASAPRRACPPASAVTAWLRAAVLAGGCGVAAAQSGDLEFDSPYTHYILRSHGSVVEMRHVRRQLDWLESAVDLKDPLRPVVPYVRMLFSAACVTTPDRVLMIGLGGGGFHHLFNAAFTNATLHTVEIDAMALKLATEHMAFRESPRNVVTIEDGRRFVKKTRAKWDWIVLDAFHGGDVPFHLKTREFYREIAGALSTNGLMISNLHRGNELFHSDVRTICDAFAQAAFLVTPGRDNVIAIAADYRAPPLAAQIRASDPARLPAVLRTYADFSDLAQLVFDPRAEAAERGRILTDDFAPAEYYNARTE
jgi:spermidine synthase